jgi:hypothetical protein
MEFAFQLLCCSLSYTWGKVEDAKMVAIVESEEYLNEIRREVCAHCVERPSGGPPCLPLGKRCGVELHLPQIIELVQHTNSLCIDPYQNHLHEDICASCAQRVTNQCPCPLDYLLPLVVEAIEIVDARRASL